MRAKPKSPSAIQVLRRMRSGDILYPLGFTSDKGVFEDGTRVSHAVIYNLLAAGKINRPSGTSISSPFTLV